MGEVQYSKFYHFIHPTAPNEETQAPSRQSSLMHRVYAALAHGTCPLICSSFSKSRKIICIHTIKHGRLHSSTLKNNTSTRLKLENTFWPAPYLLFCVLQFNNVRQEIKSLFNKSGTCAFFPLVTVPLPLSYRHPCKSFKCCLILSSQQLYKR